MLSSASAGIIGVDATGSIGILNRSAEKLIGHSESEALGHPLSESACPNCDEMMAAAREGQPAPGAGPESPSAAMAASAICRRAGDGRRIQPGA
ncbi:MAG: PAS domain-containing protein [Rhodopseudomonas palustris]|nr:PAS domain-containing protein [Rhodopseudomonas palustris]